MVNVNTVFPTKYVKAQDVNGSIGVIIRSAVMEQLGDEYKLVVYFEGHEKGMVLNKTNANNLSNLYGPESDGWIGKPMTLVSTFVDFQGQSTPALRLHPPKQQQQAFASGLPQQQPQGQPMNQPVQQPPVGGYTEINPPPLGQPVNNTQASHSPLAKDLDDEIPF